MAWLIAEFHIVAGEDSCKLSSYLHMCTMAHVGVYTTHTPLY